MPQDAYTLNYLTKELKEKLLKGKINKIIQPSLDEIVFTVYTGKNTERLYISVSPSMPRISIINEEKESPLTAPNFCMLLRKYLLSSTIQDISLINFDRIVKIDFVCNSEFFDAGSCQLYVELMGRYSNIILTSCGIVLGGNRGVNFFDNGVRPLLTNKQYVLPPSNGKIAPNDKKLINVFINKNIQEIDNVICSYVQGVAESTAKEIKIKFINKFLDIKNKNILDENDAQNLFNFINSFIYNSKLCPCVIENENCIVDIQVFPYENFNYKVKYFDNLIDAENYFFSNKILLKEFNLNKERLNSIVKSSIKKVQKRLNAINIREQSAINAQDNKTCADLILNYIYLIKPGMKNIELYNYETNKNEVINLNEKLSASKNAEYYYKLYNKQKRALIALKPQKQKAEAELEYLQSIFDEIFIADNIVDLNYILDELIECGIYKKQNKNLKKAKKQNFRNYKIEGCNIKVGRNNFENDMLTFSAKKTDLWLHAKDFHSSHIIIENANENIDQKIIKIACEICAYYSKGKEEEKVEVVYTTKKYVKKPVNSNVGFCTYSEYKSLIVKPNAHKEYLIN